MFKFPAVPTNLPALSRRLPMLPMSVAFTGLFNLAIWRGVRDLDWNAVKGRRFCVHVKDFGLRSHFSVSEKGLRPEFADRADVTFTATADDFMRLALRLEDPDTLFFNRRLLIEGNTDLGLTVKNMLDSLELDSLLATLPMPVARMLRTLRQSMAGGGPDGALSYN